MIFDAAQFGTAYSIFSSYLFAFFAQVSVHQTKECVAFEQGVSLVQFISLSIVASATSDESAITNVVNFEIC